MSKYRKLLYFCYVLIGFNLVFSSFIDNSNPEIIEENQELDAFNGRILNPVASASYTITGDSELAGISIGGSGTYEDPYLLPFDEIDAYESPVGLLIENTTKYVLIQDLYVHRAYQSNLNLTNVQNVQILNCNFQSAFHSGLYLENCTNVNITESNFGNNGEEWEFGECEDGGVKIIDSSQILIDSNSISSNNHTGINLFNCNDTQILDNNITFNKPVGIQASYCQNLDVIDNNIFNNSIFNEYNEIFGGEGLRLLNCAYATCNSNNITKNYFYGLKIIAGGHITIWENEINDNNFNYQEGYNTGDSGIYIANRVSNVSLCFNNITNGGLNGIKSNSVDDILIEYNRIGRHLSDGLILDDNTIFSIQNNYVNNSGISGVSLFNSRFGRVSANLISNHTDKGIYLFDSINLNNITVNDNTLDSNQYGLYFLSLNGIITNNLTISDNNIDSNPFGLYFSSLNTGLIQNNTIFNSSSYGCYIYRGEKLLLNANNFNSSEENLYINSASDVSISNNTFEKSLSSNIELYRTRDCNITYNYINGSTSYDLDLVGTLGTIIFGNYLGNNSYASQVSDYWNNTIFGNCWANYLEFYPEANVINGIYDAPYQRILNSKEEVSFSSIADSLPINFDYFVNLTNFFEPQFEPSSPILDFITSPDADGNFTLSWSSVPFADRYYLYEANTSIDNISNLTAIHETSLLSYNVVNYSNGTYFFAVTAFNASGESLPSNSIQVVVAIEPIIHPIENPPLTSPVLLPADLDEIGYDTDGNITLHWDAVFGADFYNVYVSTQPISSIGVLNPIGNTTQTSYFISGLTNGSYYFAIVAINSSSTSTISNVISVDVEIEETESDPPPILPVVLVFMSVGGTAIGITAANVTPVDKIVTTIKNKISKSTTPSDVAPKNNPADVETLGDEKGLLKNDSPPQMHSDPSLKLLEMPNGTPISIASIPNLSPTDLAAALKHHWANIPKNTRNLVLKAVDNYLKFKDQAELVLLNAHHALALSYLSTFMAFREGNKSECIDTLQKVSEDAKDAEFESLSQEAQNTADELKSKESRDNMAESSEIAEENNRDSDELNVQDEEEK
ncbi:right-handed parallel beta-helix repeat-containing protein [Candidatus Lokiarchaeum ossiferum]|uniref:right-handed parallel beta-helix repeat-containing protein n=1 Tax=Candidatus Lokiarchaeum ossiferum TaxID=2951803 RepID=UPI00352D7189